MCCMIGSAVSRSKQRGYVITNILKVLNDVSKNKYERLVSKKKFKDKPNSGIMHLHIITNLKMTKQPSFCKVTCG